jgi:hypothetical protein
VLGQALNDMQISQKLSFKDDRKPLTHVDIGANGCVEENKGLGQVQTLAKKTHFFDTQQVGSQEDGIHFFETKSGHSWEDIKDVDEMDSENTDIVYNHDVYASLMHSEHAYEIDINFISYQVVTPVMRATLVEWMCEVQQTFDLKNETLHMAINILDRFTELTPEIPRRNYQLVGTTSLFIAAKVN